MARTPSTQAEPPETSSLAELREAAGGCTACHLYKVGTQTVFGEGRTNARLMMVGEQPGDHEDTQGRPFVGPAGRLLDQALTDAGIERSDVYVTNAVKHFKWEPRGKRRIHSKPNAGEIHACKPWLEAEIRVLHPELIVCLGATAAQALLGRQFRVTRSRGVPQPSPFPYATAVLATVHPSSILRAPDEQARDEAYRAFVADLRVVRRLLFGRYGTGADAHP